MPRWAVALVALAALAATAAFLAVTFVGSDGKATVSPPAAANTGRTAGITNAASTHGVDTTGGPAERPRHLKPSDKGKLRLVDTMGGDISPKSVVASGTALFVAQNGRRPDEVLRPLDLRCRVRPASPRPLPNGRFLYATLNGADEVAKINVDRGEVVRTVSTGDGPRSMAIAGDGRSLYVVNYFSNTVTKLGARDLEILQTEPTNASPIGVTYDAQSSTV